MIVDLSNTRMHASNSMAYIRWAGTQDPTSVLESRRLDTLENLANCTPSKQWALQLERWLEALDWQEQPLLYANTYPSLRSAMPQSKTYDIVRFKFELMSALHQEMSTSVTVFNQYAPMYGDALQRPLHDVLQKWSSTLDPDLLGLKAMVDAIAPKPSFARPSSMAGNPNDAHLAAQWDLYAQSMFTTINQAICPPNASDMYTTIFECTASS